MGKIKQLPEHIAIKIAAGEVVERPASVVKELVENALDAGASKIEVTLLDGGKTLIEVKDNGTGMDRDDAVNAFLRHGTSKITAIDDLLHVTTLGFRGEALAAIGSSAEVDLTTTLHNETEGTLVKVMHGDLQPAKPYPPIPGTTIKVFNLFEALPARQKFLKGELTEWKACLETIIKQMFSHPEVGFVVKHNNKTVYDVPSGQELVSRVAETWKIEQSKLIEVMAETPHMRVHGVVAKPEVAHEGKSRQFFAVNGHPVADKMMARSVKDAFGTLLPPSHYPSFALNLTLHPGMVDVNIHPRKDEVRFINGQEVYRFLLHAVSQAIEKVNVSFQSMPVTPVAPFRPVSQTVPDPHPDFIVRPSTPPSSPTIFSQPVRSLEVSWAPAPQLTERTILVIDNCYLLTEHDGKLLLIDQHAAHERILYHQLWEQDSKKEVVRQSLLLPIELQLSPDESAIFAEKQVDFEALGFVFDTSDRIALKEVPQIIKQQDPYQFFHSLLRSLHDERTEPELTTIKHKLFATMACKAAVKAGDKLSDREKQQVIDDLLALPDRFTCPHGRPSHLEISVNELEKLFKRTGF